MILTNRLLELRTLSVQKRLVDCLGIDSCSLVLFSTLYSEVFCTASVLLIFMVAGLLKIIESRPKL